MAGAATARRCEAVKAVAHLLAMLAGAVLIVHAMIEPVVPVMGLVIGSGLLGAPALLAVAEPGPRTRPDSSCHCRGCRPRPRLDHLLRRRPSTHNAEMLGREHGYLHDIYDGERAAFGRIKTAEVIEHFGLTVDADGTADPVPRPEALRGCWVDARLIMSGP